MPRESIQSNPPTSPLGQFLDAWALLEGEIRQLAFRRLKDDPNSRQPFLSVVHLVEKLKSRPLPGLDGVIDSDDAKEFFALNEFRSRVIHEEKRQDAESFQEAMYRVRKLTEVFEQIRRSP